VYQKNQLGLRELPTGSPIASTVFTMVRPGFLHFLLTFALLPALRAGEAVNMSGTWDLKIDQSEWGKKEKPVSSHVVIEHNEPILRYKGTIITGTNGESRTFEFAGSIDGKEHPFREGKVVLKRLNDRTTTSKFTSADGKTVQTARTTIDEHGRKMTRRIHSEGPEGSFAWIEVYERRP
jgi:hypothetical protein